MGVHAVQPSVLHSVDEMVENAIAISFLSYPYKEECLHPSGIRNRLILFGEKSLRRSINVFSVYRTFVGTWLTVQEMAGFSVTLMKVDKELKHYLDMLCRSVGLSGM